MPIFPPKQKEISTNEFVVLMAVFMSLVALSIDAMLPAFGQIRESFQLENPNDVQLLISSVFFGMAFGFLIFGPISDSYGRKNTIYLGLGIYLVGSVISIFSTNLSTMLVGRVAQGFGGASCRVVTLAMIRDKFEGREMAKIMSLVLVFFIFVPAIAPTLGQGILLFAPWRGIFVLFILLGLVSGVWLFLRQPETLKVENRVNFSVSTIYQGILETIRNPASRGYTIASGFIFGGLVGYLSSAQQILQVQYNLGNLFSIYFGGLALTIGFASFVNARLVVKIGMEKLCFLALSVLTVGSLIFYIYAQWGSTGPGLITFMIYLMSALFCLGILFGNFNSLAVAPLGHIAGVATSVVSFVQTVLSVGLGGFVGWLYNGTVLPLVGGFFILGFLSLVVTFYTYKKEKKYG